MKWRRILAIVIAVVAFLLIVSEPTAEDPAVWLKTMSWTKGVGFCLLLVVAGMVDRDDHE